MKGHFKSAWEESLLLPQTSDLGFGHFSVHVFMVLPTSYGFLF